MKTPIQIQKRSEEKMHRKILTLVAVVCLLTTGKPLLAEEHDHKGETTAHPDSGAQAKKKVEENDHKESDGHDHKKEEGHGSEEETKNIGPDKGVTSFDEHDGFTLSQEAQKTFSIEKLPLSGSSPWTVPITAILFTAEDKSVYRVRKEVFKRVDVEVLRKDKNRAVIQSSELASGDIIVTKGSGSLRIAEVDVTSGESGHSH